MQLVDTTSLPLEGFSLIEASAGTGKTYTIAELYLRALIEGRRVEDILVVTFTRAATAELRERLRGRIVQAMREAPPTLDQALLQRAFEAMDLAPIYTLHGFCLRLLSDRLIHHGLSIDLNLEHIQAQSDPYLLRLWRSHIEGLSPSDYQLIKPLLNEFAYFSTFVDKALQASEIDFSNAPPPNHDAQVAALIELLRKGTFKVSKTKGLPPDILNDLIERLTQYLQTQDPSVLDAKILARLHPDNRVDLTFRDKRALSPEQLELITNTHDLLFAAINHARGTVIDGLLRAIEDEKGLRQRERQRIDHPDVLLQTTAQLLRDEPAVVDRIAKQYPLALIDEFQDTDPLQWQIFSTIYAREQTGCVLIGDPKQAIYGFRGADIETYLQAKSSIAAERQFTLATNHRSSPALLEGVADLFDVNDAFASPGIEFVSVDYPSASRSAKILLDQEPMAGLWSPQFECANQGQFFDQFIEQIQNLVALAQAGRVEIELPKASKRPLEPSDIAVLCGTNAQCLSVLERLSANGIACAVESDSSVFQSTESTQLGHWLAALDQLNPALLRFALLSNSAEDDPRWRAEAEDIAGLRRSLLDAFKRFGPMSLIRRILSLSSIDFGGEAQKRRLANWLQLGDILQAHWQRQPSINELYRYWLEQSSQPDAASQKLRLASEKNLLQILTLHKAKGLQYPVVFIYNPGRSDKARPQKLLDYCDVQPLGPMHIELSEAAHKRQKAQKQRSQLQEDLRVLYVGVTRAELCCFVPRSLGKSRQLALEHLQAQNARFYEASLPSPESEPAARSVSSPTSPIDARTAPPPLKRHWRSAAYSNLKGHHSASFSLDSADRDDQEPGGTEFGLLVHDILEHIDFAADASVIAEHVTQASLAVGIEDIDFVQRLINACIHTPLPGFSKGLAAINHDQKLVELGFYFWTSARGLDRFGDLIKSQYADALPHYEQNPPKLFIKGFIDLIAKGEDGRYWVIDYKTNRLPQYDQAHLMRSMCDSQYRLQYLLYLVALHRYLKHRIADYQASTHLGGASYLYVRGMPEQGVFSDPVNPSLIEALSDALAVDDES